VRDASDAPSASLEYSTLRRRLPWKPYLLGVATLPAIYLARYVLLRCCGVYYPFYNQGGWEIDGTTNSLVIDVAFFPARIVEMNLHNRLRWLPEPTGG
jgi:hypothetical protein